MPKEIVFFIDRCLGGVRLASALRLAGERVEVHDDHFAQDALDESWLSEVTRRNWIILTADERIGKRMLEKKAVAENSSCLFVLVSKSFSYRCIEEAVFTALPAMKRFLAESQSPFIAKFYGNGKVRSWLNASYFKGFLNDLQSNASKW